jgi:hypothetical protein
MMNNHSFLFISDQHMATVTAFFFFACFSSPPHHKKEGMCIYKKNKGKTGPAGGLD